MHTYTWTDIYNNKITPYIHSNQPTMLAMRPQQQQQKLHTIHLLDSIYLGQLNTSYQRDGFGIQQTFQFDTYIGYWRNNKTEGLGLALLADAVVIYSNFNRDVIDGLTIVDNGHLLLCGIFRNYQMLGIGFQYNYGLKLWKMQRYHKGVAIEVIKQQYSDINNSFPKLMNVEQSIYFHLYNYINKNYFPNQQQVTVVAQTTQGTFSYGYRNQKGAYGPGLQIRQFNIIQAGFYQDNQLHGFGFKRTIKPFTYQFGCYHKGRKDGPFLEKDQRQTRFNQYRKNILLKNLPESESLIQKNQKKYNFNCKDFFSAKNAVPFDEFRKSSLTPQLRLYNQKRIQMQGKNSPSPGKNGLSPKKQLLRKQQTKSKGSSYIIAEQKQKSSVQIMRQKMSHYYGLVSGRKKTTQLSPRRMGKKSELNNQQQDEIANEQNPFY